MKKVIEKYLVVKLNDTNDFEKDDPRNNSQHGSTPTTSEVNPEGWGQAATYGTTLLGGAAALTLGKIAYDKYRASTVQPRPAPEPSVRGGRTTAAPKRLAWLWITLAILAIAAAALAVFFRDRQ